VEPEVATALQLEEEVPSLAVDEQGRVPLGERHVSKAMVAIPMLSTMPITMTQMTTFVNWLFRIMFRPS
jgi:hypothetical protein